MRLFNRTTPYIALSGAVLMTVFALFLAFFTPLPSETTRKAIGFEEFIGKGNSTITSYASGPNSFSSEIFLIPSLGRGAHDFNELITELNENGYKTRSFDPPGVNADAHFDDFKTLADFSEPIYETLKPKILIGHAFGNRIARVTSFQNPENVDAVILLAAGGQVPMEPKAEQALRDIFNPLTSHKARMEDVEYAFFAPGNEIPDHWKRGWHTKTAIAQSKAVAASADDESWHCAGGVPMLIVQPIQDRIAPTENAYALRDKCPQEVEIIEIENAGHALLPEQPEAVAEAVLAFLAKHHPVD